MSAWPEALERSSAAGGEGGRAPERRVGSHAFRWLRGAELDGLALVGRRSVLRAGLAGFGGLSLPALLRAEAEGSARRGKSVILLWMSGGPSHIDTLDPKPEAPREVRGPFATIATALPGVRICEHLPKIAARLDRLTLIRSVDARRSNHEPNQVFQTANLEAEPRENPIAHLYPAIGALAGKHCGPVSPGMPPYVVLNLKDRSHVAWGGYLGKACDPFIGDQVEGLLGLPSGLSVERLRERQALLARLDGLRRDLDLAGSMAALDRFQAQALELIAGRRAREAFDLALEDAETVARYGEHEWCRKALLARRLVEAGARFVTLTLSNHGASGTWDTHGDNIPPYGGIWSGLRPLLPVFDHLLSTLLDDLARRGKLDEVLVIALGEFGRTPRLGTQGSTDGRDHWPVVMSMLLAGGGLRHGQLIGSTERDAGQIKERPVTPGDLAATIYRHLGVPLDLTYTDFNGRPRPIVEQGEPIAELF